MSCLSEDRIGIRPVIDGCIDRRTGNSSMIQGPSQWNRLGYTIAQVCGREDKPERT